MRWLESTTLAIVHAPASVSLHVCSCRDRSLLCECLIQYATPRTDKSPILVRPSVKGFSFDLMVLLRARAPAATAIMTKRNQTFEGTSKNFEIAQIAQLFHQATRERKTKKQIGANLNFCLSQTHPRPSRLFIFHFFSHGFLLLIGLSHHPLTPRVFLPRWALKLQHFN